MVVSAVSAVVVSAVTAMVVFAVVVLAAAVVTRAARRGGAVVVLALRGVRGRRLVRRRILRVHLPRRERHRSGSRSERARGDRVHGDADDERDENRGERDGKGATAHASTLAAPRKGLGKESVNRRQAAWETTPRFASTARFPAEPRRPSAA